MSSFRFGSGLLFASPINGVGASYAFGTLQDVSVDMSSDIKSLYGSFDTPDIAALGKLKIDVKAKFGQVSGGMFNALFFGGTRTAGVTLFQLAEAQTASTGSSPTVVAGQVGSAGYVAGSIADLQLAYAASGVILRNVGTGTPVQGEYTFNPATGTYTLAAADAGAGMLLTYTYSVSTATAGTTYSRNQRLMGGTLFFSLFLYNQFNGVQQNLQFYRALCSKLSQATKNDDFSVPEMDFTIFNDPTGRVFKMYDASEPFLA